MSTGTTSSDPTLGQGLSLDSTTNPPAPTLPADLVTAALNVVTAKADYDKSSQDFQTALDEQKQASAMVTETQQAQAAKGTALDQARQALHTLIDAEFATVAPPTT